MENQMRLTADDGPEEEGNGCWDLVEINSISNKVKGGEWDSAMSEPQDFRNEKKFRWEKSSLAKFSHFLGFSTEGLEKEILSFFYQNQKETGEDSQQRAGGEVKIRKGVKDVGVLSQL